MCDVKKTYVLLPYFLEYNTSVYVYLIEIPSLLLNIEKWWRVCTPGTFQNTKHDFLSRPVDSKLRKYYNVYRVLIN